MSDNSVSFFGHQTYGNSRLLLFSGAGYRLTMVKTQNCNVQAVQELVISHVPEAHLDSNNGDELAFVLPSNASAFFQGLFSDLEKRNTALGIASFGASVTTMEEVFLK